MGVSVTTHEAKTHLSRLLARVEAGEEVVIRRGSKPVARLVPLASKSNRVRPRVGTVTLGPARATADAFRPMTDEELREWGL